MSPILFSPNTSKFDSSQAPRLPTTNTECCTSSTDFDVSFCRISMFSCCIPHPNPICDALGSLIQSPPPPPLYTTEWVLRHSRPKFSLPNGTINYFHPLSKSNIPLKALLLSLTVLRAQLWIVWFGDLGQKGPWHTVIGGGPYDDVQMSGNICSIKYCKLPYIKLILCISNGDNWLNWGFYLTCLPKIVQILTFSPKNLMLLNDIIEP